VMERSGVGSGEEFVVGGRKVAAFGKELARNPAQ
jgi:hypothetical protein